MDFEQAVEAVADKVYQLKDTIETEEATKTALVMPFINTVLGYDVFDPTEVIPEYTADVGTKKGEKVDYALVLEGQVQILIECKKLGTTLSLENASQLFRYFATTRARIGILTNGQVWQFYMDIEKPNVMDDKPFMVLDLLDIDEGVLPQLKKLTKPAFDVESIASSAEMLKYTSALRREISEEFKSPSDDMVKMLAHKVYDGRLGAQLMNKFRPMVARALKQFLNDQANERLRSALDTAPSVDRNDSEDFEEEKTDAPQEDNGIVTTAEELQGYSIVRAIGCAVTDVKRITMRDAKSYCAILLDDNNRRTIVRLYFNNSANKKIAIFKPDGEHWMEHIEEVSDIYSFAENIRNRIKALTEM